MQNPETPILQKIRLEVGGRPDVILWRNSTGIAEYPNGTRVPYGLCPGSSDLIGLRSVVVIPAMVGRCLAVFTAIEVKVPGGRTAPQRLRAQEAFIAAVQAAGGLGGFAHDPREAAAIVDAL